MPTANIPQVLITPLKPALIQGMAQKLPVLVRVQAPDPDPAQKRDRKPYSLSLVIDRSGSMSGEPLIEAVPMLDVQNGFSHDSRRLCLYDV